MKRIILTITALVATVSLLAQTQEEFLARYNTLNKKLGPAGVGIETLLDKWQAAYPDDLDAMYARFLYHYNKNMTTSLVAKPVDKYLGEKPALTLTDSLGAPVNYFTEQFFDDEQFGLAIKAIDHACDAYPTRLDLRFAKVEAFINYEKGSPDMATDALSSLITMDKSQSPSWEYPDVTIDDESFDAMVQQCCYSFFRTGTSQSYEAFKAISEKMLSYEPDNTLFLDNMGSYWLVAKNDNKQALKYYKKVLKLKPDDLPAIQNCIIMARRSGDKKSEMKYLPELIKYSTDSTSKKSAQVRLDYLSQ